MTDIVSVYILTLSVVGVQLSLFCFSDFFLRLMASSLFRNVEESNEERFHVYFQKVMVFTV